MLSMLELADYDLFQFDNNIKPDYCNAGGLEVFEEEEWSTWYDEETGNDIYDLMHDLKNQITKIG